MWAGRYYMVSGLTIEKEEPSTKKDVSKKDAQRLQDSYRKIFQTMSEGFVLHEIICNEDGEPYDLRILDINPAFEQLTGLRKEDVLGRTIRQVLPDEDPLLIKTLGTVALTGKPMEFENHSRALKGYYKIISYSPTLLQVAALFSDITKEKDAENNIKKMGAMNRAILNSIPDQVFILSDNGTFLDYRSPLGGVTYSPPKSFLGKTINEVLPAELASQIESKMAEAQKSSLVQIFEYKLPVKGKDKYYEARISPGSDGIFVTLVRNIDEHKRMEQALLESERRFRAAIDNFPYTFIIYDRDLRISYINRVGLEMCGMSEEEVIGHADEELFSAGITTPYMESLRRALATGTMQSVKSVQKMQSGKVTIVFNYVPILDEQGRICQILGINFDVTEIEGTKRGLERALAENEMQNRLLQTAMEELSSNYKEIEELLFRISRELIVPLSTIEGFLGLLRKDVEKCNRLRIDIDIGLIGDAISRMQTLVGNALERSSLGVSAKAAVDFPFAEVVEDVMNHFEYRIASGRISITVDRDLPLVHASKNRVADVLMSIIESCIEFSSQGEMPLLHIGHFRKDDESIFFARSENKKEAEIPKDIFSSDWEDDGPISSSSSGLSMAKRIIESQGGRMWMESGPEVGCAILFTLPEPERS